VRLTQQSNIGGAVDSEHTAVAVKPTLRPGAPAVITHTDAISLRMPSLNTSTSAKRGALSAGLPSDSAITSLDPLAAQLGDGQSTGRCCQSNGNLSPGQTALPNPRRVYPMIARHSARAWERLSLKFSRLMKWAPN